MAKKQETLAGPFVSEEEQPYPIPENWCWVALKDVSEIIMGQSPIGSDTTDDPSYMPLIGGAADMGTMYPLATRYTKVPTKISKNGDLILCIRATLGKPIFSDGEYCLGRGVSAIRPYIGTKNFYRYFFLAFEQYLYDNATGTTFSQVSSKTLQTMPVPLPPLTEQQRIVDRIESLFVKLDEAKEKAQAVADGFELRKSAILHKAFTGELTERWRKEHGVGLDSWEEKKLMEVSSLQTGLMKGKHFSGQTVFLPYLRVANVQDGYFDLNEIKEIEVDIGNADRYLLKQGDVLFTEGGDFDKLGRGAVWESQIANCLHQNHVFVVRPHNEKLNPYFLSLQAGSQYGKKYFLSCSKQTTNLASINSTQLKNFPVKIPTMEEQLKIIEVVAGLIEKQRKAKEAAESVLSQIDIMKKAILARAFRGELGTNDPAEESAAALLKR